MNVYVKRAAPIGAVYTGATATAIVQYIDPLPGYKVGVNSIYFDCCTGVTSLYALTSRGNSTISATVASGANTVLITSASIGRATSTDAVAAITTGDYVCYKLDNGKYQFNTVASMQAALTLTLTTAVLDDIAAGMPIWGFGIPTDYGQPGFGMGAAAAFEAVEANQDIPFLWAENRGDPMVIYYLQSGSTYTHAKLKGGSVLYCKA